MPTVDDKIGYEIDVLINVAIGPQLGVNVKLKIKVGIVVKIAKITTDHNIQTNATVDIKPGIPISELRYQCDPWKEDVRHFLGIGNAPNCLSFAYMLQTLKKHVESRTNCKGFRLKFQQANFPFALERAPLRECQTSILPRHVLW